MTDLAASRAMLPAGLALGIVLVPGLVLGGRLAAVVARAIPSFGSHAISGQTCHGRRGEAVIGTARRGDRAQVRWRDLDGTSHSLMAEPLRKGPRHHARDHRRNGPDRTAPVARQLRQKVQQTFNNDLDPNGLEPESVALTKLNENNTFDATGMRLRSAIVSEQRNQRVAIEIHQAEKEATSVRVRARAERKAAKDRALANIARAKVEAENALSPEVMDFKLHLAKIEALSTGMEGIAASVADVSGPTKEI